MTLVEIAKTTFNRVMKPSHYLDVYEQYLCRLKDTPGFKLLEVGIGEGGSLQMWRDYFRAGKIYGIDGHSMSATLPLGPRIKSFLCNQDDVPGMSKIGTKCGPFDVVIDDGAHTGQASLNTFLALFPCVVPGGLYVIEDWGTGYWPNWPDGEKIANGGNFTFAKKKFPSHQAGMVGFVKQLVDVCNTLDRTCGAESSQINSMELMPGMVLLRKRTAGA